MKYIGFYEYKDQVMATLVIKYNRTNRNLLDYFIDDINRGHDNNIPPRQTAKLIAQKSSW